MPGRWDWKESEVDIKCKARAIIHGSNELHYCTLRRSVSQIMPKHIPTAGTNTTMEITQAGIYIIELFFKSVEIWLKCIETNYKI